MYRHDVFSDQTLFPVGNNSGSNETWPYEKLNMSYQRPYIILTPVARRVKAHV